MQIQIIFPGLKAGMRIFKISALLILSLMFLPEIVLGQNNVLTHLWDEANGMYSGNFGSPTAVDGSGNFYRAGFVKQSGYTFAQVQKINSEGTLLWSTTLNPDGTDYYQPTQIATDGSSVFVTGIVTYISSGETDFFVAEVDTYGNEQWFEVDEMDHNDVSSDIIYDRANDKLYVCGTTQRNDPGHYDLLVASYGTDGSQQWLETKDYNGNNDVGAKVVMDGGDIFVNGSSESSPNDWDIVSWHYDDNGNFQNEQRSSGISTVSDELKDGVMDNGFILLTGTTDAGSHTNFKVVCLDANNNLLWDDAYNKNNLDDEGLAALNSNGNMVVAGYSTSSNTKEDILVRKYNSTGALQWSKEINFLGEDDRGIDIIEDSETGNYLVLANVSDGTQTDVYLYCLSSSTGNIVWSEAVGNDAGLDETAISLEAAFNGDVYVTYQVNNLSVTEAYSYGEMNFPVDDEPFSRGNFYIKNSGQLKDENGQSVMDVRYYSFGSYPDYFLTDEGFSIVASDDEYDQRIDMQFINANNTHVGHLQEFEKETHFNFYHDYLKYEQQGTFDVLAWPGIYEGIDAFISSNSEGFKFTFVLGQGSDLNQMELDIEGTSSLGISGGDLHVQTITGDIVYLEPFSYEQGALEILNDDCIEYVLSDGKLKFAYTCPGDFSYPYVVQVKVGVGQQYGVSAINNMDWSTFWGGNYNEIGSDMEADAAGNLYIAGMISSSTSLPNMAGIGNSVIDGSRKGLVLKFNKDAKVEWGSLIEPSGTTRAAFIRGIGLYDNNATFTGSEVHVVGEYTGTLSPNISTGSGVPATAWQQTSYAQASNSTGPIRDLFFASFKNSDGTKLIQSPFGGNEREMVFTMDIAANGVMYFAGSTQGGGDPSASSQSPPASYTFPVYDPGDGSYFNPTHPSPGDDRAFVSAIDLSTYKLVYSSVITNDVSSSGNSKSEYKAIYSIYTDDDGAFCGEGITNYARLGFFNPFGPRFATNLDAHPYSEWTDRTLFSSVVNSDYGFVFFGLRKGNYTPLISSIAPDRYRNTEGRAYMVRIKGNSVEWDTYFGKTPRTPLALVNSWRWNLADDPYFIPVQGAGSAAWGGRGKIAFNAATSSLYFGGSILEPYPVEAKDQPGFFFQNAIQGSGPSQGKPEQFLASFSYNTMGVADKFTWGTMYGQRGRAEHFNDIVSYTVGNETFLATLSTANANNGSTTSDINKFPLADLGKTNSWYQPSNPGGFGHFHCLAITRFKVTDIVNHVSLPESSVDITSPWNVFPNPVGDVFTVESAVGDPLEAVKVYDLKGQCVLENDQPNTFSAKFDISHLAPGIYVVTINGKHNQKLVKL